MPVKTRGSASEGGSRQCDERPGLPTTDGAQEKWQRSAVWLLAIRVCSGARMEERERERERTRENPSRGAEGVTADISLRVLRLFLSSSSSCPLNQNADRRGRPTWRSKRKPVPSSISARRNRTSAERAGCQPRDKLWAPFPLSKPPTAPRQLAAVQNMLGAPYLALHTRLARVACMTAEHGERLLPPAAPPHRHNPARHQRGGSGLVIMHPEDDSIDPFDGTTTEPPFPRVWSGCGRKSRCIRAKDAREHPPLPRLQLSRFDDPPKQTSWKRTVGCLRLTLPGGRRGRGELNRRSIPSGCCCGCCCLSCETRCSHREPRIVARSPLFPLFPCRGTG